MAAGFACVLSESECQTMEEFSSVRSDPSSLIFLFMFFCFEACKFVGFMACAVCSEREGIGMFSDPFGANIYLIVACDSRGLDLMTQMDSSSSPMSWF